MFKPYLIKVTCMYMFLGKFSYYRTVAILSAPHMKFVCTLIPYKKSVQCLVWHPESTATDSGYSPYQHWLAVSSNEPVIKVYDLYILTKGKIIYSFLKMTRYIPDSLMFHTFCL